MRLWTVGHGTRALDELIALLQAAGIVQLADVRSVPRSRFNPQFDRRSLGRALPGAGILYLHLPGLGGLRRPRPDSGNTAWRSETFRGYADHMQTEAFRSSLDALLDLAARRPTAVMCAEREPRRCHRSRLADAVLARGVPVVHLIDAARAEPHALTPGARVADGQVTYPGPGSTLELFADGADGAGGTWSG